MARPLQDQKRLCSCDRADKRKNDLARAWLPRISFVEISAPITPLLSLRLRSHRLFTRALFRCPRRILHVLDSNSTPTPFTQYSLLVWSLLKHAEKPLHNITLPTFAILLACIPSSTPSFLTSVATHMQPVTIVALVKNNFGVSTLALSSLRPRFVAIA